MVLHFWNALSFGAEALKPASVVLHTVVGTETPAKEGSPRQDLNLKSSCLCKWGRDVGFHGLITDTYSWLMAWNRFYHLNRKSRAAPGEIGKNLYKKPFRIGKLLVCLADGCFLWFSYCPLFLLLLLLLFFVLSEKRPYYLLTPQTALCSVPDWMGLNRLQGLISFAARRFGAGGELWSSDFVLCSAFY